MTYYILTLLVGLVIGWLAVLAIKTTNFSVKVISVIAGIVGAFVGSQIYGNFGPSIAGMPVISTIIGAGVLASVISVLLKNIIKK